MKKQITKFEICSCDNCERQCNSRHEGDHSFIPLGWESFEINKRWIDFCSECLLLPIGEILKKHIYKTISNDKGKHFNG